MKRHAIGCTLLLGLLVPLALEAQATGQITGVVTSDLRQPLAGVQIVVRGTTLGAVTADNGRYLILNVPAGDHMLDVSFLGFDDRELPVTVEAGTPAVLDIELATRAIALDEVVVVGYGTQRREEITGAVASVSSADFNKGPARDAASLIAGKLPGLIVQTPSGDPRDESQINIRGTTSIQGPNEPLILIDGVPGEIETVPAEDIASISVLKDGSAAAVYGTRGSDGVILITTKRHQGGAPTLRYDGYVSQSAIYNAPDFHSAADYRRFITDGTFPACTDTANEDCITDFGFDTDWQDAMLRNPVSQRHNMTLAGGATNTNYTASLNYESEQGIFERSDNREVTARANIRHSMFDGRLEAEANLFSRTETAFEGPGFEGIWRQALIRNPTDRMSTEDGAWQQRGGYVYTNPLSLLMEENGEQEDRQTRLHGTVTLRPIDRLRISVMGGATRSSELSGSATTFRHPNNTESGLRGVAGRNTRSEYDRILEITGTFTEQLGGHNVTVLGGYGYQDFLAEGFNANNREFPTDLFGWNDLGSGEALPDGRASIGSFKDDRKLIGFFSRLNYDFQNRYILMGSVRYEGSTRFGAGHKWGLFPAVSAGWRISEESFMDALPFINDLRLRAGFGVTGIEPDNSYLSLTSYRYQGNRSFMVDGRWVEGLVPSRNPNPDLRWEEKQEINVGLNFSLLDFRLNGALDVYRRDTKDMLYNYSVPSPPYLTGSLLANVGSMRNSGIEAELSYNVIDRPGVRWTSSVNGSSNSNELVSLSNETFNTADCFFDGHTGEPIQQSTHRICVGGPIGNFFGFESVDIDDEGKWIVLDSAGSRISIEDVTQDDRRLLGNGIPKYHLAWNNSAQIGSFDLSVNMRGAFDFQILNFQRLYYENPSILQYNMLRSAFDPVYGKRPVDYDLAYVSYYIEDGDFWKIDNATIGYTIGPNLLGGLSNLLSGARVYISGRNLLTITGYKGMDPEVGFTGFAPGTDHRDTYPTIRTFTAGMTVSF
jgi:TonB-linked SusC/RagA family outer membrane protein